MKYKVGDYIKFVDKKYCRVTERYKPFVGNIGQIVDVEKEYYLAKLFIPNTPSWTKSTNGYFRLYKDHVEKVNDVSKALKVLYGRKEK